MPDVDHRNIVEVVSRFRSVLGAEFVEKELNSLSIVGVSPVDAQRLRVSAHPIAEMWQLLCLEAARSAEAGKFLLSQTSMILLDWLYSIEQASMLPNANRMLDDVKSKGKFHSARHEAQIAARYAEKGYQVSFIPEGEAGSADLLVATPDGEVYVECKSLRDPGKEDDPEWGQFEIETTKFLRKSKRCWSVYVQSSARIDHSVRKSLSAAVRLRIVEGVLDEIRLANEQIVVQFKKICEPEELVHRETLERVNAFRGYSAAEFLKLETGEVVQKNPIAIGIDALFEPNQTKRLVRDVKTAGRQLPKNKPSLVHIDVNVDDAGRAFGIVDHCWGAVHSRIERNHRRINAVVLSMGMLVLPTIGFGRYSIENAIIPNRRARQTLPSGFSVFGSSDVQHIDDQTDGEGTLLVIFSIDRPLSEQVGRSLLYNCSADGLRQLRVWQTYSNHTRFEVFTPAIGRKYADHELRGMVVGNNHLLEVYWSVNGVKVRLDHKAI
jgi:hypothetical protein